MQVYKVFTFIAVIIAISLQLTTAFDCTQTGITTVSCPDPDTKTCFIRRETNGTLTRGCGTDASCTAPTCLSCGTSNCNAPLMCRACTALQEKCGTTDAGSDEFNQLCSSQQLCRNVVYENGTVSRGCGLACAAGDTSCTNCDSDNCNLGIYPKDRRLCYQCKGAACNVVSTTNPTPCTKYQDKDQKCYTTGSNADNMQRGCTTDTDAVCPLATTDANCVLCDSQNGCNNQTYESVLGSCIKCSNADSCVGAQQADKAVKCASSNYTITQNSCYTMTYSNGTVQRGCINELNGSLCTKPDCEQCNGEACNAQANEFSCLTCRSDNYGPCRKAEVGAEVCKNPTVPNRCFSGEWNGVVIRGCYDDMGSQMQYQCAHDANIKCHTCEISKCNYEKYNGAATLQHMGLGLLGVIFLIRNAL